MEEREVRETGSGELLIFNVKVNGARREASRCRGPHPGKFCAERESDYNFIGVNVNHLPPPTDDF